MDQLLLISLSLEAALCQDFVGINRIMLQNMGGARQLQTDVLYTHK